MSTWIVRLDVSRLNSKAWDAWCSLPWPEGVTSHGIQPDGFEEWLIECDTCEGALEIAEEVLEETALANVPTIVNRNLRKAE